MRTLDDGRFESYLKRFRPIVPDALPLTKERDEHWRRRSALRKWAIGVAAIVIIGTVGSYIGKGRVAHKLDNPAAVEVGVPKQPLTMRDANTLLNTAPSYKAAMDSMLLRNQGSTIPKDKQSALALLAKEKIKL